MNPLHPNTGGYVDTKDNFVISIARHDLYQTPSGNYFAIGLCKQRITFTWIVTGSNNVATLPGEFSEMRIYAKAHRNLLS